MADTLTLTAEDGHTFAAYIAQPEGRPKGGVVIIQEIFGVNDHIRAVADDYAAQGYLAVAPALFDRVRPGIELGYSEDDVTKGREIRARVRNDDALLDIAAAADAVKSAGRIAAVGFCWGGTLAWLTATRLEGFSAIASYYGGGIGSLAAEKPHCPVILHFGERDHAIPLTEVDALRAAHPELPVHLYPAGHGFNCDHRGSFEPTSAGIARERTLALFAKQVG